MVSMRAFIASLVVLAFAVTGTANCALAQPAAIPAENAAMPAAHPPCHEPAGETVPPDHAAVHGEDDCTGGAACIDCALAAGLTADMDPVSGFALQGAPRLFVVKTARTGLFAHDPPPPRA